MLLLLVNELSQPKQPQYDFSLKTIMARIEQNKRNSTDLNYNLVTDDKISPEFNYMDTSRLISKSRTSSARIEHLQNIPTPDVQDNTHSATSNQCATKFYTKLFTNTESNTYRNNFVTKEVIDHLEINPHTSPWMLMSEKLSDGCKESDIISELTYTIQGIDGQHFLYDTTSEKFTVSPALNLLPIPVRCLVYRICELGYLFRHLNAFCNPVKKEKESGLVKQAFILSIKSHLDEHIRCMAVLDSNLLIQLSNNNELTTGLPHLMVTTMDALKKFMYLYNVVRACEGQIGGCLLSSVYKFTVTGDQSLSTLGRTLLLEATKPINRMLRDWIYEGNISDHFAEFFINCTNSVRSELLWSRRYTIRHSMIPSFISLDLVNKIFRIGKSINFIKIICHMNYQVEGRNDSIAVLPLVDYDKTQSAIQELTHMVYEIDTVTSKHALNLLFDTYNLKIHLNAIYRYLMLAQADFAHHLMDLLMPYLSGSANSLRQSNLTSFLESAINSTNAQFDAKDVLERLDCKIAEPSEGDQGWDVFSLYYHTRGPLQLVVTARCIDKYLKIFHFLWFLKRISYLLTNLSKDQIVFSRHIHHIKEVKHLFQYIQFYKSAMIQFITQLEYFITFQVLECSRLQFCSEIDKATDIDNVIRAHEVFLNSVTSLCLLDSSSEHVLSKLKFIFSSIIHVESVIRSVMVIFTSNKNMGKMNLKDSDYIEFIKSIDFHTGKVRSVGLGFEKLMNEFLTSLLESSIMEYHNLAFVLDFNEFYDKKRAMECRQQLITRKRTMISVKPGSKLIL